MRLAGTLPAPGFTAAGLRWVGPFRSRSCRPCILVPRSAAPPTVAANFPSRSARGRLPARTSNVTTPLHPPGNPMSPDDPKDPPRPGRIILPGSESAPPAATSRIVIPPGVSLDEPDDLPEYPRLRPLMLDAHHGQGPRAADRERSARRDPGPAGAGHRGARPPAAARRQRLGERHHHRADAREQGHPHRQHGARLHPPARRPADARLAEVPGGLARAARRLPSARDPPRRARRALLPGRSARRSRRSSTRTSPRPEQLRAAAGEPVAAANARPRALLAPHLDPRRAGATIARAYLELGPEQEAPLRVVVLGTGPLAPGRPVRADAQALPDPARQARVRHRLRGHRWPTALGDDPYHAELAHRDEHSIEFQALYLQRRLGSRPVKIVPILCGGFGALLDDGHHAARGRADRALRRRAAGRRAEARRRHRLRRRHRPVARGPALRSARAEARRAHAGGGRGEGPRRARRGRAGRRRRLVRRPSPAHDDSTRICGFAPTYLLLRACEPGPGRLLRYQQSDEPDGSMVSTAAMVWP